MKDAMKNHVKRIPDIKAPKLGLKPKDVLNRKTA